MRHIASKSIAATLAGALALTALPTGAVQAAAPNAPAAKTAVVADTVTDFSARKRTYRRGNNAGGAAALAAFGMVMGTIATIAANERRRDYYDRGYGYYGGYAPPPPPYGYYHRPYRHW